MDGDELVMACRNGVMASVVGLIKYNHADPNHVQSLVRRLGARARVRSGGVDVTAAAERHDADDGRRGMQQRGGRPPLDRGWWKHVSDVAGMRAARARSAATHA